jgi:tRNA modification GTPase
LPRARTERTAAILLDQYRGALQGAIDQIAAHLAAGRCGVAAAHLEDVLQWAPLGLRLTRPWNVVLAGRPNVGKSSLINALLGYERSLVFPDPGTTRDIVTATTAIDGWPVELADTAGLRASQNEIETAGIGLARDRLVRADLIVVVHDATAPWTDVESELCHAAPGCVVAHNKIDLNPACERRANGVLTSVTAGRGIEQLLASISRTLVPAAPPRGSAVPFTAALVTVLERAHTAAASADARGALAALGQFQKSDDFCDPNS